MKAQKKPFVYIATPCGSPQVHMKFMQTVLNTITHLAGQGVGCGFQHLESCDVVYNRNVLASMFLEHPKATHLLFIDDDMAFSGELAHKLLCKDVDIVGVAATKRELDIVKLLQDVHQLGLDGGAFNPLTALANAMDFNVYIARDEEGNAEVELKNGLLDVTRVGTGVMLVKRHVLEKMAQNGVAEEQPLGHRPGQFNGLEKAYGFFDKIQDPSSKFWFHEDYSFCIRWRERCGGKVWAYIDEAIEHHGNYAFSARFKDRLMDMAKKARCGEG